MFRVQARFQYIDYDRPSVTTARAEHYTFLQSNNERGNNSEHKKPPRIRGGYIYLIWLNIYRLRGQDLNLRPAGNEPDKTHGNPTQYLNLAMLILAVQYAFKIKS